ncbi:MAG: DUF2662 domain-containing protein [Chloroflexi bacterium]|nr:DUF2662 domain-containing protein [Chloroflexota bacterium]
MSLLSRWESIIEAVVEGGFRRLFSPRLQPVEVARALERVMTRQKVVGPASVDVPNEYFAHLNPTDFERFASFRGAVERDIAAYLHRRASEEGLRPIGPIQVHLAINPGVRRSSVRAEARFTDPIRGFEPQHVELTRRLEAVAAAPSARVLVVDGEDGQQLHVRRQPVRIGRGPDNDLVIRDIRVSRHHASVEPVVGGWIIRDLESTNGTYVDGQRVLETRVDAGAELSLGGYRLILRPG